MSHTPGPWIAIPTTAISRNPDSLRMDIVTTTGISRNKWTPAFIAGDILPEDARLIASAPDLLSALEKLVDAQIDPFGIVAANARREAVSVIAKAKGGQP